MGALTKPTNTMSEDDVSLENVIKCKCNVYLGFGTITDAEIPATAKALTDLISGQTAKFIQIGKLHKEAAEFGHKRSSVELQKGRVREILDVEGFVNSVRYGADFINLCDDPAMGGDLTFLFVPFGNPPDASVTATNPQLAVFVRGVTAVDEGKHKSDNTFGEAKLTFHAQPDYVGDAIKVVKLTATGISG